MKFKLLFMLGVLLCTTFIIGCGEYTPEEIIVNEPLVINVTVSDVNNITDSYLINVTEITNITNSS